MTDEEIVRIYLAERADQSCSEAWFAFKRLTADIARKDEEIKRLRRVIEKRGIILD